MKLTQKQAKEYINCGMAKDITHMSFEETLEFRKNHSIDIIAVSHGLYGSNAALLKDRQTGEFFAITKRNTVLGMFV